MAQQSAGMLMYRRRAGDIEVFLVHPGGPYWAKKDDGAWTIPKGLFDDGENPLDAARREFAEETGFPISDGPFFPLGEIRMSGGKTVAAWAFEGDADPKALASNTFSIEWPPRSGRRQEFPEADRGGWFPLTEARRKILPSQVPFLDRLASAAHGAELP